jgi:Holliday junction resolvase RusA-like endonuclease
MTDRPIEFSVPMLAPSLNGSKGLMRMHWATYKKVREKWTLLLRAQANLHRSVNKIEQCEVVIFRHFASQPLDLDNLYAASKIPLDALRHSGVLAEDDPSVVRSLECIQFKVSKRADQKTIIHIKPPTR